MNGETSLYLAYVKITKTAHLREFWILRDNSQLRSICKCKYNSHFIRKEEMRNHLMSYEYLMLEASSDDVCA